MHPRLLRALFAAVLLVSVPPVAAFAGPPPANIKPYTFPRQELTVADFPAEGYILDIGGGGEGVIGRLKGSQVVAIDLIERELADAPPGPLKIVMDARDLKFLDRSFRTATAFFTLLYIKADDHPKVFVELFRVLEPGGRLLIWDAVLPPSLDPSTNAVVVRLQIKLPAEEVSTGYGVHWPEQLQDMDYYERLATDAGFTVDTRQELGRFFHLVLHKPAR
jgi:SAM-dependent methyltransferase